MFPATVAAVILLHLTLTLYNFPLRVLFSGQPVTSYDYDTHYDQASSVVEALKGWGKSWAWDPYLIAGFPNGTIFDADNKGLELFVYALNRLGVSLPLAFNLFVLMAHLLVPLLIYSACRLFRFGRHVSLGGAVLAVMLWNFDSITRRLWWGGMISYSMAVLFAPLILALFYRFCEDRRWWSLALLMVLMPAAHLVHPYLFVIIAVPMAVVLIVNLRTLRPLHYGLIGLLVAATILANLYWFKVVFDFRKYWTSFDVRAIADFWFVLFEYLGLFLNPEQLIFMGVRCAWRFLVWSLAILGLIQWWREKDRRFYPLTAAFAWLFVIAYFGKYFWVTTQIQPLRYVIPLTFMALVPAVSYVERILSDVRWSSMAPRVRGLVVALAVVAIPALAGDVIYFIPAMKVDIRGPGFGPPNIAGGYKIGSPLAAGNLEYRHGGPREDVRRVGEWVLKHDDGTGRFLVKWWILGEYLAWSTRAQVIGGFHLINLVHGEANIFRKYITEKPPQGDLTAYVKRYAIKYLIVSGERHPIEGYRDIFTGYDFIPPAHRIYIADKQPSWFEKGSGKVKASINRIEVRDSPGGDIILKYHYLDTFTCKPGCRVERSPVKDDPVGFVKVPDAPRDFVIENTY